MSIDARVARDAALEEASQLIGASRLRTMLRITLPLVVPGVLVLGLPSRYYVITTAISECSSIPRRSRSPLRWVYRCSR
jgi:ABC-type spermidine/putrescine transport system permease subunit II